MPYNEGKKGNKFFYFYGATIRGEMTTLRLSSIIVEIGDSGRKDYRLRCGGVCTLYGLHGL